MALLSPTSKQLLIAALGSWPWLLVPVTLALAALGTIALRMLLWRSQRKSEALTLAFASDPSASLRLAIEELRAALSAAARLSPPDAVRLIETLLTTAMALEASDVHLSPLSRGLQISVRVHGSIYQVETLPAEASALVANRLKVLARLDLHVRDVPQDGRLVLPLAGRTLEARMSTLPTEGGERIVLRLVEGSRAIPGLSQLGFSTETEEQLARLLSRPQGLVFVTGPVGSGKSTTLYASLAHIAKTRGDTTNIVTLEDPIELRLPFATQTQINHRTHLTFASVLRSVLRQDPNVLMIGEIRDCETAEIAMQASLTGHLLLTTVHADDAIGPIGRLIEMGVEPFSLSGSLAGSISQRLVRLLCPNCRRISPATTQVIDRFERLGVTVPNVDYFEAAGCDRCDHQGYVGRSIISELLVADAALRQQLHEGASMEILRRGATERGLVPIISDGLRRARLGDTTLAEVLRVAG
ncbi:MAG: GspE/PulE family protein [Polyangiaceae bacterium]